MTAEQNLMDFVAAVIFVALVSIGVFTLLLMLIDV